MHRCTPHVHRQRYWHHRIGPCSALHCCLIASLSFRQAFNSAPSGPLCRCQQNIAPWRPPALAPSCPGETVNPYNRMYLNVRMPPWRLAPPRNGTRRRLGPTLSCLLVHPTAPSYFPRSQAVPGPSRCSSACITWHVLLRYTAGSAPGPMPELQICSGQGRPRGHGIAGRGMTVIACWLLSLQEAHPVGLLHPHPHRIMTARVSHP